LSRALDLLEKMQRDEELLRLLDEATAKDKALAEVEEYWTRRAAALQRLGRSEEACRAYEVVLRLRPTSADAYGASLACSMERGDHHELGRKVADWNKKIDENPELYPTYALALLRLHRDREALPYIIRYIRTKPNDYMWLLEFADAVERLGDHAH